MEVTSHALRMRRVDGLTFGGGLLAAIKPGEHTDFHRIVRGLPRRQASVPAITCRRTRRWPTTLTILARASWPRRAQSGRSIGFSLEGRPADLVFSDVASMRRAPDSPSPGRWSRGHHQMHSALLGTGHLRNVALALTYALAAGDRSRTRARVLADRCGRCRAGWSAMPSVGRTVLDDTAAHPDSFRWCSPSR